MKEKDATTSRFPKSLVFALTALVAAIAVWNFTNISNEQLVPTGTNDSDTNQPPARSPERQSSADTDQNKVESQDAEETVSFPSLGKVAVHRKKETLTWKRPDGRSFNFPFVFAYTANGVWVRADYRGPGPDYEETRGKELERLYAGETVVGLPAEPPKATLQEILTMAYREIEFEKASKIVLEHVLTTHNETDPPEPVVMVKVWGVETAFADSPDTVPRVRLTFYLNSGVGTKDDAL